MSSLIAIYLNDHLVVATAGAELQKRMRQSNREGELAGFLERIGPELEDDRDGITRAMDLLDVGVDRLKRGAGWSAEKLGRLKLNGRLLGYSPLSRLVELEGMNAVITANLGAWESLRATRGEELAELGLPARIRRCEAQRADLEGFRIQAAREALAGASV